MNPSLYCANFYDFSIMPRVCHTWVSSWWREFLGAKIIHRIGKCYDDKIWWIIGLILPYWPIVFGTGICIRNMDGFLSWLLHLQTCSITILIFISPFSFSSLCPVGWGYRIHRLLLCRGGKTPPPTSVLDMTLNNLMVRFQQCWSLGECRVPLHCHCSQVHSDPEW